MLTIFGGLSSPFSYSILHRLWNQVMSVSFSVDDITTLHIYTHSTATTAIIISHTQKKMYKCECWHKGDENEWMNDARRRIFSSKWCHIKFTCENPLLSMALQ